GSDFDLIVINPLEHLPHGAAVLAGLAHRLQTGRTLILPAENHSRLATNAHLIQADVTTCIAADVHVDATRCLAQPRAHTHATGVLADLAPRLQTGGTLILRAENHARLSTIAHLIEADVSTGIAADAHDAATMDLAHPRAHSHATLFKLLMDAGWMPSLVDS